MAYQGSQGRNRAYQVLAVHGRVQQRSTGLKASQGSAGLIKARNGWARPSKALQGMARLTKLSKAEQGLPGVAGLSRAYQGITHLASV
eukprot:2684802-Pyramimonas_sp.AAC.1